jgi:hypothetical protein
MTRSLAFRAAIAILRASYFNKMRYLLPTALIAFSISTLLGCTPKPPPDLLAQQWLSEVTDLQPGMQATQAKALLVSRGYNFEAPPPPPSANTTQWNSYHFASTKYPERVLVLRCQACREHERTDTGTSDLDGWYCLRDWYVENEQTGILTRKLRE